MKLNAAAQITACTGVRTLVDTTVAIEFAASWNPFIKSKITASTIIMINSSMLDCSGVFYDDCFDDFSDCIQFVGSLFEFLHDLFDFDQLNAVNLIFE